MIYYKSKNRLEVINGIFLGILYLCVCIINFKKNYGSESLYSSFLVLAIVFLPILIAFCYVSIVNKCKFFQVEVTENRLNHMFWSIPISSITQIGNNVMNTHVRLGFSTGYIKGFIIKTNKKLYRIKNNLELRDDFIKDLQSKNPNIVLKNTGYSGNFITGYSNSITREYNYKKENKLVLTTLVFIIIFLIILFLYTN